MLTKSIVGRWNLSPPELHKCVYHSAKSELAGWNRSSYASPHSRTWWVGFSAVLTTFVQLQLNLKLGQKELTSASNILSRYSQKICPRPPRRFKLGPGIFFHPCPIQLKSYCCMKIIPKIIPLRFSLDNLLAKQCFHSFSGEPHFCTVDKQTCFIILKLFLSLLGIRLFPHTVCCFVCIC